MSPARASGMAGEVSSNLWFFCLETGCCVLHGSVVWFRPYVVVVCLWWLVGLPRLLSGGLLGAVGLRAPSVTPATDKSQFKKHSGCQKWTHSGCHGSFLPSSCGERAEWSRCYGACSAEKQEGTGWNLTEQKGVERPRWSLSTNVKSPFGDLFCFSYYLKPVQGGFAWH